MIRVSKWKTRAKAINKPSLRTSILLRDDHICQRGLMLSYFLCLPLTLITDISICYLIILRCTHAISFPFLTGKFLCIQGGLSLRRGHIACGGRWLEGWDQVWSRSPGHKDQVASRHHLWHQAGRSGGDRNLHQAHRNLQSPSSLVNSLELVKHWGMNQRYQIPLVETITWLQRPGRNLERTVTPVHHKSWDMKLNRD